VVGQGAGFVIAGLIGGLVMALGVTRLVSTMLFGLSATDAASFAEVAAAVFVAAMGACVVPELRLRAIDHRLTTDD